MKTQGQEFADIAEWLPEHGAWFAHVATFHIHAAWSSVTEWVESQVRAAANLPRPPSPVRVIPKGTTQLTFEMGQWGYPQDGDWFAHMAFQVWDKGDGTVRVNAACYYPLNCADEYRAILQAIRETWDVEAPASGSRGEVTNMGKEQVNTVGFFTVPAPWAVGPDGRPLRDPGPGPKAYYDPFCEPDWPPPGAAKDCMDVPANASSVLSIVERALRQPRYDLPIFEIVEKAPDEVTRVVVVRLGDDFERRMIGRQVFSIELFDRGNGTTRVAGICLPSTPFEGQYRSILQDIIAEWGEVVARTGAPYPKDVPPTAPLKEPKKRNEERDAEICRLRFDEGMLYKEIQVAILALGYRLGRERVEQICRMDSRHVPMSERVI